jgi:hypothetical protein
MKRQDAASTQNAVRMAEQALEVRKFPLQDVSWHEFAKCNSGYASQKLLKSIPPSYSPF